MCLLESCRSGASKESRLGEDNSVRKRRARASLSCSCAGFGRDPSTRRQRRRWRECDALWRLLAIMNLGACPSRAARHFRGLGKPSSQLDKPAERAKRAEPAEQAIGRANKLAGASNGRPRRHASGGLFSRRPIESKVGAIEASSRRSAGLTLRLVHGIHSSSPGQRGRLAGVCWNKSAHSRRLDRAGETARARADG